MGAYADNDDIVPKLRAVEVCCDNEVLVGIFCWGTDLGCDGNTKKIRKCWDTKNLKPNKKESPQPLGLSSSF